MSDEFQELREAIKKDRSNQSAAPAAPSMDNRPRFKPVPEYPRGYLVDEYEDLIERLDLSLAAETGTPRGARYYEAHKAELDRLLVLERERNKAKVIADARTSGGGQKHYEATRESRAIREKRAQVERRIEEMRDALTHLSAEPEEQKAE